MVAFEFIVTIVFSCKIILSCKNLKNSGGGVEWSTAKKTICSNNPKISSFTVVPWVQDNSRGDIATSVTRFTLENENIITAHDSSRKYIYITLGIGVRHIKKGGVYCNECCKKLW